MSHLQWEQFKETIRDLYVVQNRSLDGPGGVIESMEQRHGFKASFVLLPEPLLAKSLTKAQKVPVLI